MYGLEGTKPEESRDVEKTAKEHIVPFCCFRRFESITVSNIEFSTHILAFHEVVPGERMLSVRGHVNRYLDSIQVDFF
jgi:hypothetical protein